MISYLVIVNPASGRGQAHIRAEVLRKALSVAADVTVVETARRGSAEEIVASQGPEFDRVIAVGGDGTLNEVLTGLLRIEGGPDEIPALGFLPSGTANAAIAAFGFSADPADVAQKLPTVEVRPVDVGIVKHAGGERPFLLWCGAGYDAVLIDTLNTARTGLMGVSGLVVNTPRVLGSLFAYSAPDILVCVDGKSLSRATSVILANVGEVAFGGSVADTADPFDGQLDVVAVPPASMFGLGRMGLCMLTSSLRRAQGVEHVLGTEVVLESQGDVPFQIDGEPVGKLPITVRLHVGAARLLLT